MGVGYEVNSENIILEYRARWKLLVFLAVDGKIRPVYDLWILVSNSPQLLSTITVLYSLGLVFSQVRTLSVHNLASRRLIMDAPERYCV
jgi:hypothetical protein